MRHTALVLATAMALSCGAPAPAQDAESPRATVDQLTDAATGRAVVSAPATPAEPEINQLSAEAPRSVPGAPRAPADLRRPPPVAGATTRNVRMSAPPAQAVDRCEAISAGRAPPVEGLDCEAVLEAAAFARQSPEERLLMANDRPGSADPRLATSGQAIPNAELVAQRLASGNLIGSEAAQAIASQGGAPVPQDAPTVINVTNPDGTTGTIVVPPPR